MSPNNKPSTGTPIQRKTQSIKGATDVFDDSFPNIPGAKKYDLSYNFPLQRGKWDAMEGGVRVPLIISGPNIQDGIEYFREWQP